MEPTATKQSRIKEGNVTENSDARFSR